MAKNSISDYDTTAANNTDIQSVDVSEGCPASGINNAIREMMADTADAFTQGTPIALDQTNNRVGIGTTSPDAPLEIETSGSDFATLKLNAPGNTTPAGFLLRAHDGDFDIRDANNSATRMTIDSSGDVGINEDSPDTMLHLTDNTANDGPVIRLEGSGQNAANNLIGGVEWKNGDGSGDGPTVTGAIRHYSSNSAGSGGYTTFHTHDGTEGGEGSDAVERMRVDKSGNLLVGTTNANPIANQVTGTLVAGGSLNLAKNSHSFEISRNNTTGAIAYWYYNSGTIVGNISITASATSYNTSSDHRLKENVADMTGAIARVKQLAPKRFNFIVDADTTVDGFLAHEAQTVVPEAVTGTHNEVDEDGNAVMQGIDQSKLVPLLTGALKEAITKIETLETEMTALKARVTALEDA